MTSWNFGGSRTSGGLGTDASGLLDLKALLNQVTGGTLGNSMMGLGTAVGSGNRSLGFGLGSTGVTPSNNIGSRGTTAYGNHGGKFTQLMSRQDGS